MNYERKYLRKKRERIIEKKNDDSHAPKFKKREEDFYKMQGVEINV